MVAAVLSGNRNFEGRIHPLVKASYLASPPLVVAFALAGTVDIDLGSEPLGHGSDGQPVYLADIWPSADEIREAIGTAVTPELFRSTYASVFEGDDRWRALPVPEGDRYAWDDDSDYIAAPPFFAGLTARARTDRRPQRCPRAGAAGRLGHHRPHLPRRRHPALESRGTVAAGAWGHTPAVQLLRCSSWPSRGDGARHLRQHPPAQRACRAGGAVHHLPAGRRSRCSSTTPPCATPARARPC